MWTCYIIPVLQINKKLNELNSTFDNAFLFSIGKTSEGRDMMALKVSIILFLFYLQTSPRTIWQEKSHRTIVPITRLLNIKKKNKNKKKTKKTKKTKQNKTKQNNNNNNNNNNKTK